MGAIRPLFDFETIFDIDYTMIELIQNKFKGSKYFNTVMDEDLITVRMLLRARQEFNPLTIILKDEYLDSADQLYKDIFLNYYKLIYKNIHYTDISNYIMALALPDEKIIDPMIICRNSYEVELAHSLRFLNSKVKIITPDEFSLDKFGEYFVKSVQSLDANCPDIKTKTIFLLDYGFNTEYILHQIIPKEYIFKKYGENNELIIATVYTELSYPEE